MIERSDLVPDALAGQRLDRVVAIVGDLARAEAGQHVDVGAVWVNGAVVTQRSKRVKLGDEIVVHVTRADAALATGISGDPAPTDAGLAVTPVIICIGALVPA